MLNVCAVCGKSKTDRAHIRTRGAGAGWESWEYIYLCRWHHSEQGHLNWPRFVEKYPKVIHELTKRGWHIVEEFGVKKIRRTDTMK